MGTINFSYERDYDPQSSYSSDTNAATQDIDQTYRLALETNPEYFFPEFFVNGLNVRHEDSELGAQANVGISADFRSNIADVVLSGGIYGNVLLGGSGNDAIRGAGHNDVLAGGDGFDRVSYSNAGSGVTIDLANTGQQNTRGAGFDTLSGFEWVTGSRFGDVLLGSDVGVQLDGKGGNDVLRGGTGDDFFNGGGGYDRVTYLNAANGVNVDLRASGRETNAGEDFFDSIEALTGSNYSDSLTGTDMGNLLEGKAGDDYLDGGLGNDTLIGGKGADSFAFTSTLGAGNVDTIKDFELSRDQIVLDENVFTGLYSTPDGHLYDFQYSTGGSSLEPIATIVYDQGTGDLSFDRDGSGSTYDAVLFARVTPGLNLTANSFTVVGAEIPNG